MQSSGQSRVFEFFKLPRYQKAGPSPCSSNSREDEVMSSQGELSRPMNLTFFLRLPVFVRMGVATRERSSSRTPTHFMPSYSNSALKAEIPGTYTTRPV